VRAIPEVYHFGQISQYKNGTADYDAKRRILEIVCLNCRLDGATLVPEMRKPFDVLAEGLVSKNSRGDRRCTFPDQLSETGLFSRAISQVVEFTAEVFLAAGGASE